MHDFSEETDSYWRHGYCVIHRLIPDSLLTELRRAAEQARAICHEERGEDAQRLQPIAAHRDRLDFQPFIDFYELPRLHEVVASFFSAGHYLTLSWFGILFEPSRTPWTCHWHRDGRNHGDPRELARWTAVQTDPNCWNQFNCPLYEDTSTWIVPGSHQRPDIPAEVAWMQAQTVPDPRPDPTTVEGWEYRCQDLAHAMPGGERVVLAAGDLLLYRNSIWHTGVYSPHRRRATLHDNVITAEFVSWLGREAPNPVRPQV